MTINTKFDLYQKVYINELKLWGLVKSLFIEDRNIQYLIRYFSDSEYKTSYFLEDEISKDEPKENLGFKV